ncbi:hypothetical protein TI04_00760 [Achromatium sp. WMS2]|nr:hypothetical protein TI04_00760 [Achromatium sp. WMS2]
MTINNSDKPSYLLPLQVSLFLIIFVIGWISWFYDLSFVKLMDICQQYHISFCQPNCTAPSPNTVLWNRCASYIAAESLDPVAFKAELLYKPPLSNTAADDGEYKPFVNNMVLHSGGKCQIKLKPITAARVYLLQRYAMNKLYPLYTGDIEANTNYILPSANEGYELDNELGTERLYLLIMSPGTYPMLDTHINTLRESSNPNTLQVEAATKRLITLLDGPLMNHSLNFDYQHATWSPPISKPTPPNPTNITFNLNSGTLP